MTQENFQIRKQQLREKGLIEIPMSVDTSRYFIGTVRWMDIVYTVPFIILSIFIIVMLNKTGNLSSSNVVFSFLPPTLFLAVLWIKHPDRKNVSFLRQIWWKISFAKSTKIYEFSKERSEELEKDIRTQLGIFNIANDCLETLDNRLVKVIEVSSVNLTGMSTNDRDRTLRSYQSFLNDISLDSFPFQIEQFARPINLNSYINWVQEELGSEENYLKRMLTESYVNKTNEIQKSKKMVSKSRYIIVSEKVGSNKNNTLDKLSIKAETMISSVTNMLTDKHKLKATILDNEELFSLIYSSIDYENAQIKQGFDLKRNFSSPITMGEESYFEAKNEWEREKNSRII